MFDAGRGFISPFGGRHTRHTSAISLRSMWRCAAVADIAEVSGIVPPSCGRKCFCCCPAWGTPSCAMRGVSRRFQPAAGRHDGALPDGSIAAVEVARDAVDFAAQLRQREPPAILPKALFSQFFDSGLPAFLRQKLPPADGIWGWGFHQQGHFDIKMRCLREPAATGGAGFGPAEQGYSVP